jgi:Ca2+/Na+ antiporter
MKQFLMAVSAIIFFLFVMGILFQSSEIFIFKNGISMALAILTFLWVPVFLFYAYDRRQQKLEVEDEDEQENQ